MSPPNQNNRTPEDHDQSEPEVGLDTDLLAALLTDPEPSDLIITAEFDDQLREQAHAELERLNPQPLPFHTPRRIKRIAAIAAGPAIAACIAGGLWIGGAFSTSTPTNTTSPAPTTSTSFARADINKDGNVNILDAARLDSLIGNAMVVTPDFDLNDDGTVDSNDVRFLALNCTQLQPNDVNHNAMNDIRFAAFDVMIAAGDAPLAAYQIAINANASNVRIVGLEGGDSTIFADPPIYDPNAMQHDEVIIADFSNAASAALPRGDVRIARIHVQYEGDTIPEFETELIVAATLNEITINDASASVTQTNPTQD